MTRTFAIARHLVGESRPVARAGSLGRMLVVGGCAGALILANLPLLL